MCVILYNVSVPFLAPLIKRARFLVSLQLVSGTKTYLRPLSSAVISHSQYLQQNQIQTPVSLVSGLVLASWFPLALRTLHNFSRSRLYKRLVASPGCLDNELERFSGPLPGLCVGREKNIGRH